GQREAAGPVEDQQRQVLVLPVVAVVARQRLLAMHGVVGGVGVQDDLRGGPGAAADEQLDQKGVDHLEALDLGGAADQQHLPLALTLAAAGVGIGKTRQRGGRGQRLVGGGGLLGQDLEQGVLAQRVGVVAIGVAGQDLVDLLRQDALGAVADELGGARV